MDHLTALKVFRAVAANGGFAAAARQMNLSPAAVSKNVAELEAHLKVRLINRTTRSMSLTEAGEVYRQRLERILDDLEAADAALTSMQQGPSGLLRVSAPLTLALTCLTPAIPAFLQRYPDLRLELLLQDGRQDLIAGFGLSLIPRLYVQAELAEGRLVELLADWKADETAIHAVYPSRQLAGKTRVFLDFLTETMAQGHDSPTL